MIANCVYCHKEIEEDVEAVWGTPDRMPDFDVICPHCESVLHIHVTSNFYDIIYYKKSPGLISHKKVYQRNVKTIKERRGGVMVSQFPAKESN